MKSVASGAVFSPCERYRYALWRVWAPESVTRCAFVMLNPSTATETVDDPTIRRCIGYAQKWGYGALDVVNIFAFRATDPRRLAEVRDPVGPENDAHILRVARAATRIVCAWGAHGERDDRGKAVLALLAPFAPHVLALTKAGHPGHPLYLPKHLTPTDYAFARSQIGPA